MASAHKRAPFRSSHLRQVSSGNSARLQNELDEPRLNATGDPFACSQSAKSDLPVRRLCTLWVHDEVFSTDDVLVNLAQIHAENIKAGDTMQIVALKNPSEYPSVDDETQGQPESQGKRTKAPLDPKSTSTFSSVKRIGTGETNGFDEHLIDSTRRHLFTVKETSSNQNAKKPGLQVGFAKTFLSGSSQVLIFS